MTNTCADCAVLPGAAHDDGCAVARCTVCGWQRIGCRHRGRPVGWGAVWTGEYPGVVECREFGWWRQTEDGTVMEDMNQLAEAAHQGFLVWDRAAQRWRQSGWVSR